MTESHLWFNKAVARWLDIALYKAMQRITRAVEIDDLRYCLMFILYKTSLCPFFHLVYYFILQPRG